MAVARFLLVLLVVVLLNPASAQKNLVQRFENFFSQLGLPLKSGTKLGVAPPAVIPSPAAKPLPPSKSPSPLPPPSPSANSTSPPPSLAKSPPPFAKTVPPPLSPIPAGKVSPPPAVATSPSLPVKSTPPPPTLAKMPPPVTGKTLPPPVLSPAPPVGPAAKKPLLLGPPPVVQLPTFQVVLQSTQVSGIHAAFMPDGTYLIMDRSDARNTLVKLADNSDWAYSVAINFTDGTVQPKNIRSNLFCSGGSFFSNGTFLSIGGSSNMTSFGDTYVNRILNGSFSLRVYGSAESPNDFLLAGTLTSKRWYPTAQRLEDGRIFIVGGANVYGNIAINSQKNNNPTYEFWPRGPNEGNYNLDLLTSSLPYNLYPFTHLVADQGLWIFAGLSSILLNYTTHSVVTTYPDIPGPAGLFRLYPVSATAVMLPLRPSNNYTSTIIICGGNFFSAYGNPTITASSHCASITPMAATPTWVEEDMILNRFELDGVITCDGNVVFLNGAQKGYEGLKPSYSNDAVKQPVLYNVSQTVGSRFTKFAESSGIARVYHSSSLIAPDCSIVISGSNPNPFYFPKGRFPTEFRAEKMYPWYFHTNNPRPVINSVQNLTYSGQFTVTGQSFMNSADAVVGNFQVVIMDPGFSTHNHRMGHRYIELPIVSVARGAQSTFTIVATGPPAKHIAPAGFYWLNVIYQSMPSAESMVVFVA